MSAEAGGTNDFGARLECSFMGRSVSQALVMMRYRTGTAG
jgi:hypothetical protein